MFKRILSKYLLFWLLCACVVALSWAKIFPEGVANPFVLSRRGVQILIAITMLAVGSLLPYEELKGVVKTWWKTLGGTCVQYLAMPTLAFCIAKLLHLEGAYFIGIMLAGCVPGAMASNVLTLTARGNVSYSVSLTTSATLLSPLIVPLTMWLFFRNQRVDIEFGNVMIDLLMTVVAPVGLGFFCAQRWDWWRRAANVIAEIAANLAIIWIISGVVAQNAGNLTKVTPKIIAAMCLLNFGGYLAGYFGGVALRLTPAMRRALTIEVGMQNAGLGTFLAMKFFGEYEEAALFCASYSFECMATGVILAQVFRYMSSREAAVESQSESSPDSTTTA